jgi:inhibitor of cysteine peptidase
MRKHLLLTCVWIGLTGWACGQDARPAEKTDKPIEAAAGKEFSISLDSNRTTGYGWQLAKPVDEKVVKAVRNIYQEAAPAAKDGAPRVGAGGKEVWTFKAVKPGKTAIEFKYVRPWEKDTPPVKTAKFQVEVTK